MGQAWFLKLKPISSGLLENQAVSTDESWLCFDCIIPVHREFLSCLRLSQLLYVSSVDNLESLVSAAFYTQLLGNEEQGFGVIYLPTSLHHGSSIPPMSSWLCFWTQNIEHLLGFMTSNWNSSFHCFCAQLCRLLPYRVALVLMSLVLSVLSYSLCCSHRTKQRTVSAHPSEFPSSILCSCCVFYLKYPIHSIPISTCSNGT